MLDPHGRTSHFIWRDQQHVLAWARHPMRPQERFCLYRDRSEKVEIVGEEEMTVNGHCSYLPGKRWILNDTYPDRRRLQHLDLYDTVANRRVPVASLLSPPDYQGEWRCDLHPRFPRTANGSALIPPMSRLAASYIWPTLSSSHGWCRPKPSPALRQTNVIPGATMRKSFSTSSTFFVALD